MKRKLLLTTLLVALFVCLFVVSTSATDIPEWTDVITYETGENAIAYKDGFDTTSRVMLSNGDGTYSTYPTNYIIKGTDAVFSNNEIDFTAIKTASGNTTYTNASIIRLEVPSGFTSVQDRSFRKDTGLKTTSMLTIKLPEGIITLGGYNFYNNNVVVEIELPDSLTTIDGAELHCSPGTGGGSETAGGDATGYGGCGGGGGGAGANGGKGAGGYVKITYGN